MITKELNDIRVITATDGYVLTNKEESIFGKELYLGIHDAPSNYHEIEEKEAERIQK